ncbi:hypothetical protein [Microtetraspora sp. AC03309]|uniref:hypothetical protein n=1 Tax=Microtetraspora sp. AC03309 TaxID=2779376 RepID=UPI001E5F1003|nr:hypothetical protein [Microtetraspora sp. AC03309]
MAIFLFALAVAAFQVWFQFGPDSVGHSGPVRTGQMFPGGAFAPPQHPHRRCAPRPGRPQR